MITVIVSRRWTLEQYLKISKYAQKYYNNSKDAYLWYEILILRSATLVTSQDLKKRSETCDYHPELHIPNRF